MLGHGDLLRTRVDVWRGAQNQELMQRMDKRADLQLRLQHTVEGLSVVDMGWMYNRQIQDPDGNVLELVWMDISAMPQDEAG